jgi:hypothetical protein
MMTPLFISELIRVIRYAFSQRRRAARHRRHRLVRLAIQKQQVRR